MSKAISCKPEALFANPWNTNVVAPENEQKLDEAIRRLGFFKPVIVREIEREGGVILEIIGGEHRWQSAKRMNLDEIPVMNLGPISDQLAKEISLADNARYGADDTVSLAHLLEEMGNKDLHEFLPYTDADITAIFTSSDIDLDDLELDDNFEEKDEKREEPIAKAPKTHTLMRFKVPIEDAERIEALVQETIARNSFTDSDQLTNAGDALVELLLGDNE